MISAGFLYLFLQKWSGNKPIWNGYILSLLYGVTYRLCVIKHDNEDFNVAELSAFYT